MLMMMPIPSSPYHVSFFENGRHLTKWCSGGAITNSTKIMSSEKHTVGAFVNIYTIFEGKEVDSGSLSE